MWRMLRNVLILLFLIVVLLVAGVAGLLWSTLPPTTQQAHIPGLAAPVEIGFDADGIPRIRAANDTDAAAALGFVHARDRMFQMELMRRAASGRLSEIAGPATLPIDRMMRVLGLRRARRGRSAAAARRHARAAGRLRARRERLDRAARPACRAGVPAARLPGAMDAGRQPALGRDHGAVAVDQLAHRAVAPGAGRQGGAAEDRHAVAAGHRSRPPRGEPPCPTPRRRRPRRLPGLPGRPAEHLLALLPHFPAPFTQPDTASNEWAVDGAHSATGAPLLAGDPHLAFGFPGIWYLARIDTPDTTLAGATAPGVPFLVLGHNRAHRLDLHHHRRRHRRTCSSRRRSAPTSTPRRTARAPSSSAMKSSRSTASRTQLLTVRETRHGPVISDLDAASGPILAVSMANLQPGDMAAAGLLALNLARSVAEAGRAAAADHRAGPEPAGRRPRRRIGLFVTGRVPIRRAGDGSAPVPGADGAHDWIGWASGDQLAALSSPRPAAGWSTPTSASRRRTSRCSSAATGSATGAPGASASCWPPPRAPHRRTSRACSSTWSVLLARDLLPRLLAVHTAGPARGGRARPAAPLGRQHGARPAAAADLHRLAGAVHRPGAARRRHPARRRRPAQRVRRLRAVAAGRPLVRRRLHRAAARRAGGGGRRPCGALRTGPGRLALGPAAPGGVRQSVAAPPAAARALDHVSHRQPGRRHHDRPWRAGARQLRIRAWPGVSRGV